MYTVCKLFKWNSEKQEIEVAGFGVFKDGVFVKFFLPTQELAANDFAENLNKEIENKRSMGFGR